MLHIQNLHVCCEDVKILDYLNLHIHPGELHIIMGPNGAGKSTFAKVLSGDDSLSIISGEISLLGQDLLEKAPEERAHMGLFIGFQQPPEIPGVNNKLFLKDAYNACRRSRQEEEMAEAEFDMLLSSVSETYEFASFQHFLQRNINEGFSGGERKKNEIWQMLVLEPEMILLDEPDSGLDVDALRFICKTIEKYRELHPKSATCIVTHNPKLGSLLEPDHVHILLEGKIACSGGVSLMQELEEKSYHEVLARSSWGVNMLGFLEHTFPIVKDSPIHQAAQAYYEKYSQLESFKAIFRSYPWFKNLAQSPEDYHIANGGSETAKQHWLHHENSLSCECILINGKYESSLSQLPEGVLSMTLKEARSIFSTFIKKYTLDTHPLAFLNSVCVQEEGVVIYIPEEFQVSEPICIRHICSPTSRSDKVIYSPRIIVIVGKHSSCRVFVSHHTERESGVAESFAIVNGLTEVFVSEGAELSLTMQPKYISEERISWAHMATIEAQGACSIHQHLQEHVSGCGWFDNTFSMIGDGAHGESLVSTLSPKKTWVRNLMYHDAERTTSRQNIKSILSSGHFLFEGGIHITTQGMFSDAYQKHDTLLLSDDACVTTFPRLEILTDDVKASHGAAVGPLDPQQIFYMQSRGMTREEAQKKLVQGFLSIEPSQEAFPKLSEQM